MPTNWLLWGRRSIIYGHSASNAWIKKEGLGASVVPLCGPADAGDTRSLGAGLKAGLEGRVRYGGQRAAVFRGVGLRRSGGSEGP